MDTPGEPEDVEEQFPGCSSWPVFVAPLIVAGLGMGCIFAPMITVAMRNSSAKNGFQVGAGQSGGSTHLGPGLPARVAAEIARIGHDVFTFTYVTAMRQTMPGHAVSGPWTRSASTQAGPRAARLCGQAAR